MKRTGWLISKYLLTTIIPYFVFSWLLLSVILFVQQASRFSDIFFSVNIPSNLVWQLTIALIPNVIAFTCPMAILVGTIIGLTKMQGDSELVAIRASGVGNLQIALPIMILGVLLSVFAFFVNLKGVPLAATLVRNVTLQTAIKKLESPIEPGVFNSELAGYTIYVKGGDFETGRWKNIFIYNEDKANGSVRLITSQNGRIDTTDQLSELVLENASVSTLPVAPGAGKYVSENIGEVRFAIKTGRKELIEKLSGSQISPEELGLQQLSNYADAKDGKERVEAQLLWQRRLILSITPLIFCLLGTVIVLRFSRGSRGFGSVLALLVLIGFYFLTFFSEQLARVGTIGVLVSGLIPIVSSGLAIAWFSFSRRFEFWSVIGNYLSAAYIKFRVRPNRIQMRNLFVDLTTGLRDFDLIRNLLKNFLLTLCFLTAIFVIFTGFELWKFAGTIDGGVMLLAKYLFFLLPFVYLQIAPSAAMIAILATYVVKSRQNEIVTWASAGQSVYRLLTPCFLMMILLGGINWLLQEKVLPRANQQQDTTRNLIRNHGVPENQSGKFWVATGNRIYSFEIGNRTDSEAATAAVGSETGAIAAGLSAAEGLIDGQQHALVSDNHRISGTCSTLKRESIAASDNDNGYVSSRIGKGSFVLHRRDSSGIRSASDNEIGYISSKLGSGSVPSDYLGNSSEIDVASDNETEYLSCWLEQGNSGSFKRQNFSRVVSVAKNGGGDVSFYSFQGYSSLLKRLTPFRAAVASDNENGYALDHLPKGTTLLPGELISARRELASDNDRRYAFNPLRWGSAASPEQTRSFRRLLASDNETGYATPNVGTIWGSQPLMLFVLNPFLAAAIALESDRSDSLPCFAPCARNLTVYEFANNGVDLQAVYRAGFAVWENRKVILKGSVEKDVMAGGTITNSTIDGGEFAEPSNPFAELRIKPTHLNSSELKAQIAAADSDLDQRNLTVALEKKYTTLFLPFVLGLFTAPFSLSLSRKGNAATVGYAIGLWLLFTGTSNIFEQLGLNGILAPTMAIWSPLVLFSLFGVYLLSKVRT